MRVVEDRQRSSASTRSSRWAAILISMLLGVLGSVASTGPAYAADTEAPVFGPTPDLTVFTLGPREYVSYPVTAVDVVDGYISPRCSPERSSYLNVGVNQVMCTATDSAGNTATAGFTVSVVRLRGSLSGSSLTATVGDTFSPVTLTVSRDDGGSASSLAGLQLSLSLEKPVSFNGAAQASVTLDADGQAQVPDVRAGTVTGTGSLSMILNGYKAQIGYFLVRPGPAVRIAIVYPSTLPAGEDTFVNVQSYDQYGNARAVIAPPTLDITPDGSCTNDACRADDLGSHAITATSGTLTASKGVNVVPGPAASVRITPNSSSVAAGDPGVVVVTAYDRLGHPGDDVTAISTLTISPDGTCSAGSCSATTAGPHTVTATFGSLTDTATLTITPAATASIKLTPGSGSTTAGAAQPYTVRASDRFGNTTGDVTSTATLTISPDGTCSAGSCTATTAGPHTITARSGSFTDTAALAVRPGPAAQVTATAGNAQQEAVRTAFGTRLGATVTDAYGNVVPGATVTFTVTGPAAFAGSATTTAVTSAAGVATAPTLTTGTTTGSVTITATTGTASAGTFLATVISASSARADLKIAVAAPTTVARNGTATVSAQVTNNGPNAASTVSTGLVVGAGLSVNSAGGGTVRGSVVLFNLGSLASGATQTYSVTVRVSSAAVRSVTVGGATVALTRDGVLGNNVASATARVG